MNCVLTTFPELFKHEVFVEVGVIHVIAGWVDRQLTLPKVCLIPWTPLDLSDIVEARVLDRFPGHFDRLMSPIHFSVVGPDRVVCVPQVFSAWAKLTLDSTDKQNWNYTNWLQ